MTTPAPARIRITRRAQFSAAHRYSRPEWDEAKNLAVFGDNVKLHGHNYVLEATVEGTLDAETGMAADIGLLDAHLAEVAALLGWRELDGAVPGLEGKVPTTENLALLAWGRIAGSTGSARLVRVRLYESADLYVELESGSDLEKAGRG